MSAVNYTQKATVWKFTVDGKGNRNFTNSGVFRAREYDKKSIVRGEEGEKVITSKALYIEAPIVAIDDFVAVGDFSLDAEPVPTAIAVKDRIFSDMFPSDVRVVF